MLICKNVAISGNLKLLFLFSNVVSQEVGINVF